MFVTVKWRPKLEFSFIRLKETIDAEINPISGYFKSNSRLLGAQQKALEKELVMDQGELARLEAELAISVNDLEAIKNKSKYFFRFFLLLCYNYNR